jgi:hypothetical protein
MPLGFRFGGFGGGAPVGLKEAHRPIWSLPAQNLRGASARLQFARPQMSIGFGLEF